ncbi:Uncharacterised protein [Dermatophilus congolensis]|uniref:Uncharacterized protein n=1 Tax=Dermatophilus congolensis TaxID=1863 RepID=A0A239VV58_9MICO|nr:Uncharacterised protein [Dermatophilus congolensis]
MGAGYEGAFVGVGAVGECFVVGGDAFGLGDVVGDRSGEGE